MKLINHCAYIACNASHFVQIQLNGIVNAILCHSKVFLRLHVGLRWQILSFLLSLFQDLVEFIQENVNVFLLEY